MKLRSKILSYTLPLILIPFLLMAVAVYYFVIRANQIQIQEEKSQRLNEVIVSFGQEIDSVKKDIRLLSDVPAIAKHLQSNLLPNSDKNNQESQAKTILGLFFKQNPYYSKLSLVDEKGKEIVKFSKSPKSQELGNLKSEGFFKRTLISGSVQTPAIEIQANKFVITFTKSIVKNEFLGLIVLTLDTKVFERTMRPMVKSGLNTFLFDDRGIILANSFGSGEEKRLINEVDLSKIATELLANSSFEKNKRTILDGEKISIIIFAIRINCADRYV